MRHTLWRKLWIDEHGAIVTTELVLIGSTLALGSVVGLTEVRDSVNTELSDVAQAIGSIDQTYYYSGVQGHGAFTAGSAFIDRADEVTRPAPKEKILVCADVFTAPKGPPPMPRPKEPVRGQDKPKPPGPPPAPAVKEHHAGPGPHTFHAPAGTTIIINNNLAPNCNPAPVAPHCPPQPAPCPPAKPVYHAPPVVHHAPPVLPFRPCGPQPLAIPYGYPEGGWQSKGLSFPLPAALYQHNAEGFVPQHQARPPFHPAPHHRGEAHRPVKDGVEVRVTDATDDDLKKVAAMDNVRILKIDGKGVTNAGLELLRTLGDLEVLCLQNASVDDGAAISLAQLSNLRELQLGNVNLSDASTTPLKSLTGLERLVISGTRITDAGLNKLLESNPGLRIDR